MRVLVASLAVLSLAGAAQAAEPGRFQLQAIEGGVARLDTATGALDYCRTTPTGLDCAPALAAPAAPARAAAAPLRAPTPQEYAAMERQLDQTGDMVERMLPMLLRTATRMRDRMEREADALN
jgi:hypothetical protein